MSTITVYVRNIGKPEQPLSNVPLKNASVSLYTANGDYKDTKHTDAQGHATFRKVAAGRYTVYCHNAVSNNAVEAVSKSKSIGEGENKIVEFDLPIISNVEMSVETQNGTLVQRDPEEGDVVVWTVLYHDIPGIVFEPSTGLRARPSGTPVPGGSASFSTVIREPGSFKSTIKAKIPVAQIPDKNQVANVPAELILAPEVFAISRPPTPIKGNVGVSMTRTETEPTEDLSLWTVIRNGTEALSFNNYLLFMNEFCDGHMPSTAFMNAKKAYGNLKEKRYLPFTDTDAYRLLKAATEAFVMVNCGVADPDGSRFFSESLEESGNAYLDRRDLPGGDLKVRYLRYVDVKSDQPMLPYLALIRSKLPEVQVLTDDVASEKAGLCYAFIREKLLSPCMIELIWSYWMEEGMLVQTLNAISRRFQNVRSLMGNDPLANMEIDPLRPLNNLLWGYIQDEQHRLTVVRRSYEYDHHYGIRLEGKAIQRFRPVDTRSKFLEAFHHLLRLCTVFYRQDDDTTVKADAFPILNALKEVHLILSEGAHNQYGDLPSTARIEMLMQQWLLARPEFREFLPTRLMVAYPEPWMDRVDAMKKLQNWTDTSVTHFRYLAIFGEQLLLSIRFGHWSDVYEPTQAFNWARFWRPQVQGYIHAYRAATGAELDGDTVDSGVDSTLPSVLLQKRLTLQHSRA